jgi:ferredoxin
MITAQVAAAVARRSGGGGRIRPAFVATKPLLAVGLRIRHHGGPSVAADAPTVRLQFLLPDETTIQQVTAKVGESLLQVAHANHVDLEGACEGVCACSTCHLIFPQQVYNDLPDPSEEEEDMLDMAYGLTDTSRLGCQIIVTPEMDGLLLTMPKAVGTVTLHYKLFLCLLRLTSLSFWLLDPLLAFC